MNELENIAYHLGGDLKHDSDGPYIQIDTGDNTSKENYDDLLGIDRELEPMLNKYEISDKWADHDTQIIEFREIK